MMDKVSFFSCEGQREIWKKASETKRMRQKSGEGEE
jgi:hypothetical protein